jgi:hypothetical protein
MATLDKIYYELKALRQEIAMLLPREPLAGYAHPKKIMSAYKRATSKYPNRATRLHAGH